MKKSDVQNQLPEESYHRFSRFTNVVCKIYSDCWSHGLPRVFRRGSLPSKQTFLLCSLFTISKTTKYLTLKLLLNKLHTIVFLGKNAGLVFREMKHGIVEGKGLQLFCGYQDVDSSITFLNSIFQIIKQGLDDFNGILLVSMKQSIRCTHYQCTIHDHCLPKRRTLPLISLPHDYTSMFFFRNSNAIISVIIKSTELTR